MLRGRPRHSGPDGEAEAAEAWLSNLIPGRSVGLWFRGERLWHERLLLHPSSDGRWWVLTPDEEVQEVDLMCGSPGGPIRVTRCRDDGTCSPECDGKFYRFDGYPTDEGLVTEMHRVRRRMVGAGSAPPIPASFVTHDGVVPR